PFPGSASASLSPCGPAVLCCASTLTGNTVRQTEQRARTPAAGTFAGSMRKTVEQFGQVAFIGSAFLGRHRVVAAVDDENGSRQRLRVALHFGGQLAYLRRMREVAPLVRHDADRQRHER